MLPTTNVLFLAGGGALLFVLVLVMMLWLRRRPVTTTARPAAVSGHWQQGSGTAIPKPARRSGLRPSHSARTA